MTRGPAWKPQKGQKRAQCPSDSDASCKPLAPHRLQAHPYLVFTLRALTPYLALQVQSQTPTNTSMGAWPGVFISTADTLSWVTRLLTCGHVLLPGVWPAVHGSHRIRVVTAAHLMGIGGEAERQGRRACPFLPTGSPPHVHCSAKGESENAVVTVTPFSWASWGAGFQQPHSHQLGWCAMPQSSRRALWGTCAGFCEQMGSAHLWPIQMSPEAHG